MKPAYKLTLIGVVAILMLAIVGSIASREWHFEYSNLTIVSFLIYIITAYKIAKIADLRATTLLTGFLGFFDGSIGFSISYFLEANTIRFKLSVSIVLMTAAFMFIISAILGIVTWYIQSKASKSEENK